MNKQSAKRRREDDDDGSAIAMDRLSQLPQPILHNILSLLSQKDAVRTCVFSKSWRYLWHGRYKFELRGDDYFFARKTELWSFLDKTLQRSLNLSFGMNSFVFPLPLVVFHSESLVELHLQGLSLNTLKSTDNVMLNNLQTLRLHDVYITDEIFEKIISSCPLIDNLDLYLCRGLKSIKLHKHHNIKDFACFVNDDQTIIEFEDPHPLESVRIQNCLYRYIRHKNMHFTHLKSLDLYGVHLPAETFDNFSSFFPCLSELILKSCDGLKEFRLFSSSIKRLTIKSGPRNRIKAFIDTPNILYFEFSSDGNDFLPSIKFTTTSNEWKSHISLWYMLRSSEKDDTSWLLKLNRLLKSLSQSYITLSLNHMYKKLHINDSYAGVYKPVVVERV
ncbi:hypothetical protein CASFOL_021889 [Castilleja foliolosa]|uniref:F-box domain-containing protein n=1 Tax=Castilleja foliolosa TaxID=1961234 RepID=A0ABD3CXX6_9LAMI